MDTRKTQPEPQTKTAYDADTPQALIDFMSTGWAEAPIKVSHLPNAAQYKRRRDDLSQAYPGAYIVVPSGTEQVRANDTNFRFRTASNFAYLVGPGEPDCMLVLEPRAGGGHDSLLFVLPHNRGTSAFFTDRVHGELWVGRHRGVDESQIYYGVDRCRPAGEIRAYLDDLRIRGARVLHAEEDAELATHLSEMRLIKDETEIAELRTCNEITKRGFEDVIALMGRTSSEREIEAAFWRRARIEANDVGYLTIAASGEHACTLHWTHNHGTVRSGDLLLLDAGVEADSLYTADVTRTLPISGKFTEAQRTVYDLVYKAQQAAFAQVKPGNDFLAPNNAAMEVLAQGLIDLGILKCSLAEALDPQKMFYKRYTLHGVSHMLGIDVHDCAKARTENYRYGKLREGMALTVEPGLYFQPDDETVPAHLRGIGVRIEDDVVVTANGCDNLTAIFPSEASEVEAWIGSIATKSSK
ncbi:MAG TPA: aminopeptidase P family protein [Candidatus Baltobacteraceae bacterium]|nr:aminopeptidase P family protein [Candidatus Baltobacteraceae bacterium]